MAFVPAPGVVSLQAIALYDNQPSENTFNYHVSGTIDLAKLTAIATTYFTWVNTYKALWGTNVAWTKAYLRDLTSQNGAVAEYIPSSPIDGTGSGTALPNNVSFAVKRQTGLAGRKMRGRVYWIGLLEGERADDNHLAVSVANNRVLALNTLMANQLSDNAATEVILHRASGTYTAVAGYVYSDLTIDSMRRRLPDHNRHR